MGIDRKFIDFDEEIGKIYGRLTVIRFSHIDKNGDRYYECVCDCLNETKVILEWPNLKRHKRGCGCLTPEEHPPSSNKSHNWKGFGEIHGWYFSRCKRVALKRGISFEVSGEEIWEKFLQQDRKCALSGLPLKFAANQNDKNIASLDRIDNKLGYIKGNIQWVHKHINYLKGKITEKKIFEYCSKITRWEVVNKLESVKIEPEEDVGWKKGLLGSRYSSIRYYSRKLNRDFNVSKEYLWKLFISQGKLCALSGIPLVMGYKSLIQTASLDRIDSSKGYIENNVQWVHKDINMMKQEYSQEQFIEYCRLITKTSQEKALTEIQN